MHHLWTNQPTWTMSIAFCICHFNRSKQHSFVSTTNFTHCDRVSFHIILTRMDHTSHSCADKHQSQLSWQQRSNWCSVTAAEETAVFPTVIGNLWFPRSVHFPFAIFHFYSKSVVNELHEMRQECHTHGIEWQDHVTVSLLVVPGLIQVSPNMLIRLWM